MRWYRVATVTLALTFIGIGFALLVVTAVHGGGVVGYVLGALFIAGGAGRLALLQRRL